MKDSPADLHAPNNDVGAFEHYAPVGINITCGIDRLSGSHLGNIANIVACGVSIFVVMFLIWKVTRRVAAVGEWQSSCSQVVLTTSMAVITYLDLAYSLMSLFSYE